MGETDPITVSEINTANLLLIVVGAHLRAEIGDRPLANQLCDRIQQWLDGHAEELKNPFVPVVCCDVWYVNHKQLQRRPTISLGGPGVNALSAYYHQKLNKAFVRDEQMVIQLDPDFVDLRACLWGMDHKTTAAVLDVFVQKYLEPYLRAVATQVEPMAE
jgi:hypothetical protein